MRRLLGLGLFLVSFLAYGQGTITINHGGTGATTKAAAFNALSPMTAAGDLIYGGASGTGTALVKGTAGQLLHSGTTPTWSAVDLTADVTGTLPLGSGGTGQTTANAALNALLPSQTGNSGKVLSTNATNTSWINVLTNPMTTTGDIIYSSDNSGTPARLGVGASTTVLHGGLTPSYAQVVNADVSGSAAIAYSKLNLTGSVVNADVSSSAAIAYSKLNLTGSIVNADVSGSAAIAYSKLNLTGSIVNADISTVDASKITTGTLAVARGGTNLGSGTSGGVLAYTASGTLASSAALGANAVVVGGGAGVVPATGGNTYIMGNNEGGTPNNTTVRGTAAAGTNIPGADIFFDASNGTGSAGSGKLIFRTAPVAASSSTSNTFEEYLTVRKDGVVLFGGGDGGTAPHTGQIFGASGVGTNVLGANLLIQPGNGTGNQNSGHVLIQAAPKGTTGTAADTMQTMIDVVGVSAGVASVSIGSTTSDTPIDIDTNSQVRAALLVQNADTTTNSDSLGALRVRKGSTTSNTGQFFIEFAINAGGTNSGRIVANGANAAAFAASSDRRLKENIEPLSGELERVTSLNPVAFDYIAGGHQEGGFIAQEIQEVYPDAVSPGPDGYLQLAGWSKTDARLVQAIKELKAANDALAARVAALEAR